MTERHEAEEFYVFAGVPDAGMFSAAHFSRLSQSLLMVLANDANENKGLGIALPLAALARTMKMVMDASTAPRSAHMDLMAHALVFAAALVEPEGRGTKKLIKALKRTPPLPFVVVDRDG